MLACLLQHAQPTLSDVIFRVLELQRYVANTYDAF